MPAAPITQFDSIISSSPAYEFANAVDSSRFCRAVMLVVADANLVTVAVQNEVTGASVNLAANKVTGVTILPIRTKTAVTATGFAVFYLY